ncbi:hypothetical protein P4S72_11090 [Vibrio sp. PP-XX7]
MSEMMVGVILLALLFLLLASGFWVSLTLMTIGFVGMYLIGNDSFGLIFATTTWGGVSDWSLAASPYLSGWAKSYLHPLIHRSV